MNWLSALFKKTHYQMLEEQYVERLFALQFQGKSLLDIGCGQGKYLYLLRQHCSHVTGVDANPAQVEILRREGCDVFLPDDLPARKFDVLLMSHVVEHMTAYDLVGFMNRYLPMLKDDGRLIILTPLPGIRFWHDYTHVRPYTPQSLGMMFGIIGGPVAFRPKVGMTLEDIRFFRDSWRIRNNRHYYPSSSSADEPGAELFRHLLLMVNIALAGLHAISGGRLGKLASWMGVYRHSDIVRAGRE